MAISDSHIVVRVDARKLTTRDGTSEDDALYLSQIKAQVKDFMQMLDFSKADVSVTFGFDDPETESDKCVICFKELSPVWGCPIHGTSGVPKSTHY